MSVKYLTEVFILLCLIIHIKGFAMSEKYQWRNRVLNCSSELYIQQKTNLQNSKELAKELKLIAIEDKDLKNQCQLIGLDGGVKERSSQAFSIEYLEKLINSMPMRVREMKEEK